jgi:hypothetical protein
MVDVPEVSVAGADLSIHAFAPSCVGRNSPRIACVAPWRPPSCAALRFPNTKPQEEYYAVYMNSIGTGSRARSLPIEIHHAEGVANIRFDQVRFKKTCSIFSAAPSHLPFPPPASL